MAKDVKDITVNYQGRECNVSFHHYHYTSHLALRLSDANSGEHVEWASMIHVPGAKLAPNEVLVQDYPGTRGMLAALAEAGVVRATGQYIVHYGHRLPVAELLIEPPAKLLTAAREGTSRLEEWWANKGIDASTSDEKACRISVPGLPLPEPSPSLSRQQDRSRGR